MLGLLFGAVQVSLKLKYHGSSGDTGQADEAKTAVVQMEDFKDLLMEQQLHVPEKKGPAPWPAVASASDYNLVVP